MTATSSVIMIGVLISFLGSFKIHAANESNLSARSNCAKFARDLENSGFYCASTVMSDVSQIYYRAPISGAHALDVGFCDADCEINVVDNPNYRQIGREIRGPVSTPAEFACKVKVFSPSGAEIGRTVEIHQVSAQDYINAKLTFNDGTVRDYICGINAGGVGPMGGQKPR